MSTFINTVTEVATLGLVDDVTGSEAQAKAARDAAKRSEKRAMQQ